MSDHLNNESEYEIRFSDEKLYQFHSEFTQHMIRCENRFNDNDEKFQHLINAQQNNTAAISSLIEETRAIVQLHKDIQGVKRLGEGLQTFLAWVVKWPLIGTGLYAMIMWVVKYLHNG
jgi:hypothetical protein